jgi:hypothetical protein
MPINLRPFSDPLRKAENVLDNIDQLIDNPLAGVGSLIDGGIDGFLEDLTGTGFGGGQIDKMKATLASRNGLARQNRFKVRLMPPSTLSYDIYDNYYLCESVTLPSKQILTAETGMTFKRPEVLPYAYTMDNVSMTFICTQDYYIKKMFDEWLNLIIRPKSNIVSYPSTYQGQIEIQGLNLKNRPIYKLELDNVYPINVSAIDYSTGSNDDFIRVTVELAHDDIKE